jgi:hypothetical protein
VLRLFYFSLRILVAGRADLELIREWHQNQKPQLKADEERKEKQINHFPQSRSRYFLLFSLSAAKEQNLNPFHFPFVREKGMG